MKDLEVSSAENNDLRSLERKLVHSRLKITEQGDEVLLIKRQKVAADRQIKVLRREVEDAVPPHLFSFPPLTSGISRD